MPVLIWLREELWTGLISVGDQVPTCPVFTRAKIKSRFGILVNLPSHHFKIFTLLSLDEQHFIYIYIYNKYSNPSWSISHVIQQNNQWRTIYTSLGDRVITLAKELPVAARHANLFSWRRRLVAVKRICKQKKWYISVKIPLFTLRILMDVR